MSSGVLHTKSVASPDPAAPSTAGDTEHFTLGQFSIDEYRPIRVAVIGAGFSGIACGIRFSQRVPNLDLTIYEKNAGIGGTWYVNKYPGLTCDIPSHCYQYTFEENPNWSAFYASGPEIRSYLERVVDKYKLMRYIKLQHEVTRAEWDDSAGKWRLRVRRTHDGHTVDEFDDSADVLFNCIGALGRWKWPDIEGLHEFKGRLLHSANWDVTDGWDWEEGVKDWGDKKVGVIGVGSSAIQIVPALQPKVKQLVNFVKGKTWLVPLFSGDKLGKLMHKDVVDSNYAFTEEDRRAFSDPEYYRKFRHELEADLNSVNSATLLGSKMQEEFRKAVTENMLQRLKEKPWIADKLMPDFPVACRRPTPGPGYLEALCKDNVEFVSSPIKRVTATGIETVDGEKYELDVIVCATGYDVSYQYPFPIIGRNGVSLNDKFKPYPKTYMGICVEGFPNWFQTFGPNGAVGAGSLLIIIEKHVDYAVEATLKLQRERLKSMDVKREAVEDFDEYLGHYFPKTVFSANCRSWYKWHKEDGRVITIWPGSCLHAFRALEHPRWEDFNYERLNGVRNRLRWLGDGQTYNEKNMVGDRAWYLDEVDIPLVPE